MNAMTAKKGRSASSLLFPLLAFLLLFAPLFRAGNRPLPLLVIELLSLGLLLVLLWTPRPRSPIPPALLTIGTAVLMLPLLFLMPVPEGLWEILPGRQTYLEALRIVAPEQGWKTLSLVPERTEAALYATLPALAVFGAGWYLTSEQLRKVILLIIGLAMFQATLGLMQFGAGTESPLYLGNPYSDRSAVGTYINRDHLAGFLAMVFPVALALLAATLGKGSGRGGRRRGRWRRRLEFMTSMRGHQAAIYAVLTVVMLLGLVLTRSRMGVALAMVGLFLAMLAFARRLGGSNVYGTLGTLAVVVLVLLMEIGLAPVLDRFSKDPLQDARLTIFSTSAEGIGEFFPLGSGSGTFPQAYPAFQVAETGPYVVNHAHNDYLETLFEQGLFSLALILFGLVLFARQWAQLWIPENWGTLRFIQVGAGIGLTLMLLHSLVDFNLHIPANLIVFSFLAAVFFRPNDEEQSRKRIHRHTHKHTSVETTSPEEKARDISPNNKETSSDSATGEWAEEKNPFL